MLHAVSQTASSKNSGRSASLLERLWSKAIAGAWAFAATMLFRFAFAELMTSLPVTVGNWDNLKSEDRTKAWLVIPGDSLEELYSIGFYVMAVVGVCCLIAKRAETYLATGTHSDAAMVAGDLTTAIGMTCGSGVRGICETARAIILNHGLNLPLVPAQHTTLVADVCTALAFTALAVLASHTLGKGTLIRVA